MPRPLGREQLAAVLRSTRGVITPNDVTAALDVDRRAAAKLLARWTKQGWLKRVRHGTYVPLPLDATPETTVIANPWVLVPSLFEPGYVGGWSAAEHWELTEQIFRDVCVFTTRKLRSRRHTVEGTTFVLHRIDEDLLFGTKGIWESGIRINVSDPHRTIVDMLARPETGGGIRHTSDCLAAYLASRHAKPAKLLEYGERLGSGAVFKRLGFLLEELHPDERLLAACQTRLSTGYAKLDPALPRDRLVTRWRLWVPKTWKGAR